MKNERMHIEVSSCRRGGGTDICCKGKRIASPQRDPTASNRALCGLSLYWPLCCMQSLVEEAKESGSEGTEGWGWTLSALLQICISQSPLGTLRCSSLHNRACIWFPKEIATKHPTCQTCWSLTKQQCLALCTSTHFCTLRRVHAFWRVLPRCRHSGSSESLQSFLHY